MFARMIPRRLSAPLVQRLADVPAVALIGPRQVGKATLALNLDTGKSSVYLDLETEADRAKLSDSALYFDSDRSLSDSGCRVNLCQWSGLATFSSMADDEPIRIIRDPIPRETLAGLAEAQFGDMIKAVVDLDRGIMAIGGELHADEEALLLSEGSRQANLWGINLYPAMNADEWIEYDSMINVRPTQGNRSRDVEDAEIRQRIRMLVESLVADVGGV